MPRPDTRRSEDAAAARAGGILTIDLDAAACNYRRLCKELAVVPCAAVVKADAYGLGVGRLAPAFAAAGARAFFVGPVDEGIELDGVLAAAGRADAEIYVLNGVLPGTEPDFRTHRLIPVLNSLACVERWRAAASAAGQPLPAALHVDTGMSRLGLPDDEVGVLAAEPGRLDGIDVRLIVSHLACAEEPDNPLNAEQLTRFRAALAQLPEAPACLANSSGIFLGPDYHFDLARGGVALYGVNPTPERPNPMRQVVRLQGRILQVREIDPSRTVGYGATHRAAGRTRIATIGVGYADGYMRALSNRGHAVIEGRQVPVVGRVSMDSLTLDVTELPEATVRPGGFVDLIGPDHDVDALAEEAGTIGYEILTALGHRYHRVYVGS